MTEIPEKEEVGDDPNHSDLLSNLPLSIIHSIISLVPIREAVRTCILSSQWRYTWVTLPNLVFENEHYSDFRSKENFGEFMENLITNVLLCHKGPIYKFQMSVTFSPRWETMDQWLMCLSRNDIREFIIDQVADLVRLHSSIYSCQKLTYLRLYRCDLDSPPSSFKGFLFLREVHLDGAYFHSYPPSCSCNGIESAFASSPLIEKLEVIKSNSRKLLIDSPSLKYLFVDGYYEEMSLCAPHLAVLEIKLWSGGTDLKIGGGEDKVCNYTQFLGGFMNLEKLRMNDRLMKYLSWDIVPSHRSLVFPRLKDIELEVNFNLKRNVLVAALLVLGAPNLEKLTINCGFGFEFRLNFKRQEVSVMDIRSALRSRLEKLRVAKMIHVGGRPLEMEFIKYLLEHSPVLEVMTLHIYFDKSDTSEKNQILREVLLNSTCASPIAKIILTDSRDECN